MEYKRIRKDNYTFHLINTERFKLVDLVLVFTKKYDKENVKYYSMLTRNLTASCKKYNTRSKMVNQCEWLYSMSVGANYETFGDLERVNIYTSFLNPMYVEDFKYEEIIDFFFEIINNPNVKDGKFNSTYFKIAKKDVETVIKSKEDNPSVYSTLRFNELMYKKTPKEYDVFPTLEELETVNEKNLYDFYKKLFSKEYKLDILFYGQIDESKVNYIEKKLKDYNCNNERYNVYPLIKRNDKVIKKIDSMPFNQSKLYIGYDISDLNDYELKYVLRVFNTILGTMNDSLLFNIVREENSLCYTVNSYYSVYYKSLVIYAGINKDNYEKTVELIKTCITKMSDIKLINKLIHPAKKTINTFLNNYYDDSYAQLENKYINEFDEKDDIELLRDKLSEITSEDVVNISNKLKLSVVYMMKGDN